MISFILVVFMKEINLDGQGNNITRTNKTLPAAKTCWIFLFVSCHGKKELMICADSEGPDQNARMRILILAFAVRLENIWTL